MTWVCDNCYGAMEVERLGRNYNRVYCPKCGTEWFVDDNDEYINDDDVMADEEELDVYDAALIWASNGKDEDYMFGYSEEELEDAL